MSGSRRGRHGRGRQEGSRERALEGEENRDSRIFFLAIVVVAASAAVLRGQRESEFAAIGGDSCSKPCGWAPR